MTRLIICRLAGVLVAITALFVSRSNAQDRYFPMDHRQPTGTAARWNTLTRPQMYGYAQPVRITLPSQGHVTFFSGAFENAVLTQAPSQVGMLVGHVYRFRISGMPEFPGVELYPTVEILDRLHPPADHIHEFPVPVELTESEIEAVLQNRMVTKVVYLEQPDLAQPVSQIDGIQVEELSPTANLLEAADHRGRPMAILRLGGRVPDPHSPTDRFFSQSPVFIANPHGN